MKIKLSITQGILIGKEYLKNIFPFKETEMSIARIIKGDKGDRGLQGDQGEQGIPGTASAKGDKGDTGTKGDIGPKGDKGDKGDKGNTGIQGEKGLKGDVGKQGIQGLIGEKGNTGDTGTQGPKGDTGEKGDVGEASLEAVLIPYGSDLNDYKTIGFYYTPAGSFNIANRPREVTSFSPLPKRSGFALLVEKHTGVKQTFSTDHPTGPIMHIRQFDSDLGWSEWKIVNEKGDKGDTGAEGAKGEQGIQGDSPDLEVVIANITKISNLLKDGATLDQSKTALLALGSEYKDLFSLASTFKTFLTANDVSDSTINSWKEIETFLAGITDTQSLTSLLTDLKSEITNEYTLLLTDKAASVHGHAASDVTEEVNKRFMTDAERSKLEGIAAGANDYTHPDAHSADMITESTAKRFVTDTEKATWNGKASKVTKVSETVTTKQLQPNTFHVWGSVASLTITLAPEIAGIYNEYMFQFESGATATTLNLPSTVILPTIFSIVANKTYQVSIVDNLLTYGGW